MGLALSVAAPAIAQQRPAPVDTQQLEKRIDATETERRRLQRRPPTPTIDRPVSPAAKIPLFKLRTVSVAGATALPREAVQAVYTPYLGKVVSQADLEAIATGISDLYRSKGFHLTRAIVPPQDVHDGVLRIQVIEGSISTIHVEGEGAEQYGVYKILSVLLAEHPSKLSSVERQLLIVNDTPGVKVVDIGLEEEKQATGRFSLKVRVQTWRVYTTLGLDNSGSHAVGPLQAYMSTFLNSSLVAGDTLGLNLATVPDATRELKGGRLLYNLPIGINGFRLGGSGSYNEVWPSDDRRLTDTRTINNSYELRGSFAPVQTRDITVTLFSALGYTNETEQNSFGLLYSDRIRLARLGLDLRLQDGLNGSNYFTVGLRQGLNAWDATRSDDIFSSRFAAPPNFSVLEFAYTRYQKITDAVSVKGAVSGQFASDPLFLSQSFFLGGAAFGPGYYSGDNGIAGLLELRFDQTINDRWLKGFQVYGFVDGGQTWNRGDDKQSLASAGAGLRTNIADQIYASVAYATPISETSQTSEFTSYRWLFSLSTSLKLCPDRAQLRCF